MAATDMGRGGTGVSIVRLLRSVDKRRNPFLNLVKDDFLDDQELTEDCAEVREDVTEEVLVWPRCSLEQQEAGCVEFEVLEGGGCDSGTMDDISSADMLLVTRSRVVFGSCGTLIPRLSAVCRKWRSTSSSVVPWSNLRTIVLYFSLS